MVRETPNKRSAKRTTPLLALESALLKDRAYTELRELIQTGVYLPGAFLSERQLVNQLGMSKTPIRSALQHLESQGLVAVSPQQGIVVKDLSAHEISDLFEMRGLIEPFVVTRLASRQHSAEQITQIEQNLEEQRVAASTDDTIAATRLDIGFHLLLATLLDNREIITWMTRCFDKLHRSILRINRLSIGRLFKSQEDHTAVFSAIVAGKSDKATQLIAEHLRYGRQFLLGGE